MFRTTQDTVLQFYLNCTNFSNSNLGLMRIMWGGGRGIRAVIFFFLMEGFYSKQFFFFWFEKNDELFSWILAVYFDFCPSNMGN